MKNYTPNKSARNAIARSFTAVLLICCGAFLFSSCKKKGPAEKAGEQIDEATEEVRDAIKDATN